MCGVGLKMGNLCIEYVIDNVDWIGFLKVYIGEWY